MAGFYVALTIVHTWPLVTRFSDVLPNDLGDPMLNTWILWWNAHAVPLSTSWWNAPMFWPSTGALAFSEVLLGVTPLTSPIQWLGGSPIAAYNVAFFVTFPLSALAAHALAYKLTGRHDAAIVSGLVYGFNPVRTAHFPHLQVLTSYWMPAALLGLHEYVGSRQARWLWVFGLAWLMQALSNGYFLLFFPVLVGLWIAWHALSRTNHRALSAVVAAWVVTSLPLVPLVWRYQSIHDAFGMHRGVLEIASFNADLTSFLDASPLLKFWTLTSFFCVSICAAFGFARLTARAGWTARVALAFVVCAGILADSWIRELPLLRPPERLHALELLPPGTPVLELPLGDPLEDIQAMYRGMFHERPVMNGYSGFFPPSYDVLRRGFEMHDPGLFDPIAAAGPVVVAVNAARDPEGLWSKQLAARLQTRVLGEESGRTFFALPGRSLPPEIHRSDRLPIRSISANLNGDRTHLILDGDPETRWDSGPQRGTEVVTIDLGTTGRVDGVTTTIREHPSDFPRLLLVETSEDGLTWTTRWRGSGAGAALTGALRHPLDVPIEIAWPDAPARLIRLRQLGQDPIYYWSIFELTVWGRHTR